MVIDSDGHDRIFGPPPRHPHRGPRRPAPLAAAHADRVDAGASGRMRRLLIVEDEPSVRLVFRAALESNDLMISTAEDGESALRWLSEEPYDLVLLDLQIPGIKGMDVLKRLRAAGKIVPVVVITAHDSVPIAVEAMKLGAIDFLSKPLTPEVLRRVVNEVQARHGRLEPKSDFSSLETRPRDLLTTAKRALNHRLFHRAEVLLRQAIADQPSSAEAWYLLGVLREVQHRPRAAQEAYRAALEIIPGYEPARFHLMKFPSQS